LPVFGTAESVKMPQGIPWVGRRRILGLWGTLGGSVFKAKFLGGAGIENLILFGKNFIMVIVGVVVTDVWVLSCGSLLIRLFLILWSSDAIWVIE
jgi:hypothetical protein